MYVLKTDNQFGFKKGKMARIGCGVLTCEAPWTILCCVWMSLFNPPPLFFFQFCELLCFKPVGHSFKLIKATPLHFHYPLWLTLNLKHYLCHNLHLILSLALLISLVQTKQPKVPDGWINEWSDGWTLENVALMKNWTDQKKISYW